MNATHTPGPWLVEPINGGETYQITSAESKHFVVVAETPVDGTGRDEANAKLIAAAPELLAVLQHAVRFFDQLQRADVERYRAVIAKARGQA